MRMRMASSVYSPYFFYGDILQGDGAWNIYV